MKTLERRALRAIGGVTALTGAVQAAAPQLTLRPLQADDAPAVRHFFGTVGMFMVCTGSVSVARPDDRAVVAMVAAQKLGAAVAVSLAVKRGLLSPLALGVAGFDAFSALLAADYWRRHMTLAAGRRRRPAPVADPGRRRHARRLPGGRAGRAGGGRAALPPRRRHLRRHLQPGDAAVGRDARAGLRALAGAEAAFVRGARRHPAPGLPRARRRRRKLRAARGIAGTFNVCDFAAKTCVAIPHEEADLDVLTAGVSLPIVSPAVRRGGRTLLDAVWIKDANLTEALRRGSEELWLVWCIGNHGEYRNGPFQQYVHMIEIAANGALNEELALVRERGARLHVIRPRVPLPLDPDFFLGRIDASTLIAMGYRDAVAYLAGPARRDPG